MGAPQKPTKAELYAVAEKARIFWVAIQDAFLIENVGRPFDSKRREQTMFGPTLELADALDAIRTVKKFSTDWEPIVEDAVKVIREIHLRAVESWGWQSYVKPKRSRESRVNKKEALYKKTYVAPYYSHALAADKAIKLTPTYGLTDDTIPSEIRGAASQGKERGYKASRGVDDPVQAFVEAKNRLAEALVYSSSPPMPLVGDDHARLSRATWGLIEDSGFLADRRAKAEAAEAAKTPAQLDQESDDFQERMESCPEGQELLGNEEWLATFDCGKRILDKRNALAEEARRREMLSRTPNGFLILENERAAVKASATTASHGDRSQDAPENREEVPKTDQAETMDEIPSNIGWISRKGSHHSLKVNFNPQSPKQDIEDLQIVLNGKTYRVKKVACAALVAILLEYHPRPISQPDMQKADLKEAYRCLKSVSPSKLTRDVVDFLDEDIRAVVYAESGKGFWLDLDQPSQPISKKRSKRR